MKNRIEFGHNAPAVDVLSRLRAATREQHAEIDAGLPLAARDASEDDYHAHLRCLLTWLGQMDAGIAAHRDGPYTFGAEANRAGLALIRRDLDAAAARQRQATPAASGTSQTDITDDRAGTDARQAAVLATALPGQMADPAFRWGAQYVIEGSAMGASMLYRRFSPVFVHAPMHFFGAAANAGRLRWNQFCLAIGNEVVTPTAMLSAERGAVFAFDRFSCIAMPRSATA